MIVPGVRIIGVLPSNRILTQASPYTHVSVRASSSTRNEGVGGSNLQGARAVPRTIPETATWGERWRYDDPFHALGMVPMAGMAYRVAVIGGSYLLDLFTAEQQGITPISFPEGESPGWLNSNLVL